MKEVSEVESGPKDEYGWSEEELRMPLLFQAMYFDFLPEDGSRRMVKASARWDGHKKQVIVRAVDGFVYIIDNINKLPDLEEVDKIHEVACVLWRAWYMEQIKKPENIPGAKHTRH